MQRSLEMEILDRGGVPDLLVERAYRDLTRIHRVLGDTRSIISAIRQDALPVRRILDIGCAHGAVMRQVASSLAVEVVGVDLNPPVRKDPAAPIVQANAICDPLPHADIAFSMYLGHHLAEDDLVALIRNVRRYCRRFLLLDLVRHPLPLMLFRTFVAPFISQIAIEDGKLSIRRSYTAAELLRVGRLAVAGTHGRVRHSVSPLFVRQILDISYP